MNVLRQFMAALCVALATVASVAHATDGRALAAAGLPADAPMGLIPAVKSGLSFVRSFPAEGGLTGYILTRKAGTARYVLAYSVTGGQDVLLGKLVDAKGEDLTRQYLDQYAPKIDPVAYTARIQSAPAIVEGATDGAAKATIYVFMDPNCYYCHLTWMELQSYEAAGLQVRWIPVGIIKADSLAKSAALLDSPTPAAALHRLETNFDEAGESGGIAPEFPVPAATQAAITANFELMQDMGFLGTPTVLYRDASGKLTAHEGIPKLSELPAITGLPAQTVSAPELQRWK